MIVCVEISTKMNLHVCKNQFFILLIYDWHERASYVCLSVYVYTHIQVYMYIFIYA
jgi:hypothetical protein